jgi:hypothetical protein
MTFSDIEIIRVSTKKDLDDFICFPDKLYSQDKFYVRQLTRDIRKHFSSRNPFFMHADVRYFLAKQEGNILGRIASILNRRHIEFHQENTGFFGFFESVDRSEVSSALLHAVSETLQREGMDSIRGPMNFSTNEECGLLVDGFHMSPLLMTPYNHSYYAKLLEQAGMHKAKDLYAYILDIPHDLPEKIHRIANIAVKKGIYVRPLNKKTFEQDMMIFKDVYNSAWSENWGFIPLTDDDLRYLGHNLKPVVVPEMTMIAEKDGRPIGFMGLLPDFNFVLKHMHGRINPLTILKAFFYSRKIKDLRLLLLGIKSEYRNRGVDALLFREGFKGVKKGKYKRVEFSWILEDNISVQRLVEMIGGKLYKKFRIYEKKL